MLHEIEPYKLYNEFRVQTPKLSDYVLIYDDEKILLKKEGTHFTTPKFEDFNLISIDCHYLLSVDKNAYFLAEEESKKRIISLFSDTFEFKSNRTIRFIENSLERFGTLTGFHIAKWESLNRFCGKCGKQMLMGKNERSMVCSCCNNTVYPKISPVVIVAVHCNNKLLMARNISNPNKELLFLISGFVEIGESFEQAAAREVLEETGVHIKNIKYFGSEPWPFSESLIAGYTAELDGSDSLCIQKSELEIACWVNREDIPPYDTSVSISAKMIESFRNALDC